MNCKYIKLASGDDIIAGTEDKCDTFKGKEFITIIDPVKVGIISFPRAGMIYETVVFMPWIVVAASGEMQLSTQNIVLAVDIDESVASQYKRFISRAKRNMADQEIAEDYIEIEEDEDEEDDELEDNEENNNDDDNNRRNYH